LIRAPLTLHVRCVVCYVCFFADFGHPYGGNHRAA
jgi:hypothetical protein